jgi:hypothetical protein
MSYTVCLKDCNVEKSQEDICDFVSSVNVTEIQSISKSYNYKNITNLCLYDNEFADTDYIGNYTKLSEMYGPDAINIIDIKVLNYLQQHQST